MRLRSLLMSSGAALCALLGATAPAATAAEPAGAQPAASKSGERSSA